MGRGLAGGPNWTGGAKVWLTEDACGLRSKEFGLFEAVPERQARIVPQGPGSSLRSGGVRAFRWPGVACRRLCGAASFRLYTRCSRLSLADSGVGIRAELPGRHPGQDPIDILIRAIVRNGSESDPTGPLLG